MTVKVDVVFEIDGTIDLNKLRRFLGIQDANQSNTQTDKRVFEVSKGSTARTNLRGGDVPVVPPKNADTVVERKGSKTQRRRRVEPPGEDFAEVIAGLCAIGFKKGEARSLVHTALAKNKFTGDKEAFFAYLVTEGMKPK